MPDVLPDRRHNREEDSPEALRQSIEALAEAIAKLESRLDDAAFGLKGEIIDARSATRQLAVEVENMGQVLVRRIETAKSHPKPKADRRLKNGIVAAIVLLTLFLATATFIVATGNNSAVSLFPG